jgi:hypothetical protein
VYEDEYKDDAYEEDEVKSEKQAMSEQKSVRVS